MRFHRTQRRAGRVHRVGTLAIAASLALAGCGGDGPAGSDPGAAGPTASGADGAPTATSRESTRGPRSLINDFRFEASGVERAHQVPDAAKLTAGGGCRAPNQLSLGFHQGNLQEGGYFYFSMDSQQPIGPGVTGVIEPVSLTWDNGTFVPDDLPPGVNAQVPNRLEGTGRLTITEHTGLGMAGRMVATAEGDVSGDAGDAHVRATFDMNLACGR